MTKEPVLSLQDLSVEANSARSPVRLVDEVSFELRRGRTLALVGESGCGKSLTALAITRLLPRGLRVTNGRVVAAGTDLISASEAQVRTLRGRRIAMIFQEPMTALNPLMSIGDQVCEAFEIGAGLAHRAALNAAADALTHVGIPDAPQRLSQYPHELSGGMRQRVMIAMALAAKPDLLIADEPTTALDVTIQAQVLQLLRELQSETGTALLLITHDLGVVAQMADDVAVMYAGRVVEKAPAPDFFSRPLHPYSRGLLACVPPLSPRLNRLAVVPGTVPAAGSWPSGCRFHPRCDLGSTDAQCNEKDPPALDYGSDRVARCWKAEA